MKHLIAYLFGPKFHNAAPDPRPREKKDLDHKHGVDVAAGVIKVGERIPKLPFTPFDQYDTSSCGAQAAAHGRRLSSSENPAPLVWYRGRSNFSQQGMFLHDVLRMEQKAKSISYPKYSNEQYNTEQLANSIPNIVEFDEQRDKEYGYVQIQPYNAYAVLEAISDGHAPTVSFFATLNEWSFAELVERDRISLMLAPVRHYVKALPHSVYKKGGDYWFSALESSPYGGHNRREIPMRFLSNRMYLGAGYVYKKEMAKPAPAQTIPDERCEFGQRSNSVSKLQRYMFEKGRMAKQHITGFYGPITANAVLAWQKEHLKNLPDIERLRGRWWGPASIQKAREIR